MLEFLYPIAGLSFHWHFSSTNIQCNSTTFNNLTINNTASGGSRVSLASDGITVNGVLNLQSANASSTQGTLDTGIYS